MKHIIYDVFPYTPDECLIAGAAASKVAWMSVSRVHERARYLETYTPAAA